MLICSLVNLSLTSSRPKEALKLHEEWERTTAGFKVSGEKLIWDIMDKNHTHEK